MKDFVVVFFFQAEDGIRYLVRSRGLGDVYKRQFLPFVYFLNLRFPSRPPADRGVIIRQAVWVGIFVAVLAWLQLGRVLTLPLGIILGAAFILVEVLLRVWERSRWKPNQPN